MLGLMLLLVREYYSISTDVSANLDKSISVVVVVLEFICRSSVSYVLVRVNSKYYYLYKVYFDVEQESV